MISDLQVTHHVRNDSIEPYIALRLGLLTDFSDFPVGIEGKKHIYAP